MKTVIKYLKLPFSFSPEVMQGELQALSTGWRLHYNAMDFEGDWSILSLRSIGGSTNNILAETGAESVFADTELLALCPYLKQVIDSLACEKRAVRLMNLKPGAIIKEHKDRELSYEHGEARIHIPVTTNVGVDFFLDDERMSLREGECWYMNFNLKHRLANNGATDRVHLVIDCVVNDWMRELFEHNDTGVISTVADASFMRMQNEKGQMIAQLRIMNTPISLEMAERLEKEIAIAAE